MAFTVVFLIRNVPTLVVHNNTFNHLEFTYLICFVHHLVNKRQGANSRIEKVIKCVFMHNMFKIIYIFKCSVGVAT